MLTLALQRQALYDWLRLRGYQAPATVASLADQDGLTPYARKVFYVNHPQIAGKSTFFNSCPSGSREQTIVLGCYHSNQNGIFLLDVSDPLLNGVEQVTAAHEMLHAAYDRLSSTERNIINGQLLDYYDHGLQDPRVKKTIDAYRQSEPHDVVNEMHSIFGTEVANLPPPLEQYYTRYFANRAAIATFASNYQSVFTSRQNAVAADDAQLAMLKTRIRNLQASLQAQQIQIENSRGTLMSERNNGSLEAYNAAVPAYNAQVDAYDAAVQQLQALINQYNQLVSQRNTTALQEDQLVNELQSNVIQIQK